MRDLKRISRIWRCHNYLPCAAYIDIVVWHVVAQCGLLVILLAPHTEQTVKVAVSYDA
jgi:hypothetical protein